MLFFHRGDGVPYAVHAGRSRTRRGSMHLFISILFAQQSHRHTICNAMQANPPNHAPIWMDLPFPSPPLASLDQPDPFSTHSSRRDSSAASSIGGGGSSGRAPAYPYSKRHGVFLRTRPIDLCPSFVQFASAQRSYAHKMK